MLLLFLVGFELFPSCPDAQLSTPVPDPHVSPLFLIAFS